MAVLFGCTRSLRNLFSFDALPGGGGANGCNNIFTLKEEDCELCPSFFQTPLFLPPGVIFAVRVRAGKFQVESLFLPGVGAGRGVAGSSCGFVFHRYCTERVECLFFNRLVFEDVRDVGELLRKGCDDTNDEESYRDLIWSPFHLLTDIRK